MRPAIVIVSISLLGLVGCGGDEPSSDFSAGLGQALSPLIETHGAQDIASGVTDYSERRGREIVRADLASEQEVVDRLAALEVPDEAQATVESMRAAFEREIELKRKALADGLTQAEYRERICCTPPEFNQGLAELERLGFLRDEVAP